MKGSCSVFLIVFYSATSLAQVDHIVGIDLLETFRRTISIHYEVLYKQRRGVEMTVDLVHAPFAINNFSSGSSSIDRTYYKSGKIGASLGYKFYRNEILHRGGGLTSTIGLKYLHQSFVDPAYFVDFPKSTLKETGPSIFGAFTGLSYMLHLNDVIWIEPTSQFNVEYFLQRDLIELIMSFGLNIKMKL